MPKCLQHRRVGLAGSLGYSFMIYAPVLRHLGFAIWDGAKQRSIEPGL